MSTSITASIRDHKIFLAKCLVLLFAFGFGFLPPFGDVTPFGMRILGALIGAIIGWILIDMIWSSWVAVIALGLSGAYASMEDCFAACFGTQTALLLLGSGFICAWVVATDSAQVILKFFMNLSICKKSPYIMSFMFFFAAWVVATLTYSPVTAVLFIEFYKIMSDKSEMPFQHRTNTYFMLGINVCAAFGDITFPFRPTAAAMVGLYKEFTGVEINFVDYCVYVTTFLAILIVLYVLLAKFVFRIDMSFFKNAEDAFKDVKPANRRQKATLIMLCVMMIALMIPSAFPNSSFPLFALLSAMGTGGITITILIAAIFIEVSGKPLMDLQKLSGDFQWGTYLCICVILTLGGFMSSDEAGISATMSHAFSSLLPGLSPTVCVIILIAGTVLLTNIVNNLVAAMIFISLLFSLQDILVGINLLAVTMAIIVASFIACAFPSASPVAAYVFGRKDLVNFKTHLIFGVSVVVIMTAATVAVYYPILAVIL